MTASGTAVVAEQGHAGKEPRVATLALQTRHRFKQNVTKWCEVLSKHQASLALAGLHEARALVQQTHCEVQR